ncbi:MAG: DUF3866 family protein [Thermoleophilia bacterium]|nr:DUF3866 family protein [Thermoleophilia bacterium]
MPLSLRRGRVTRTVDATNCEVDGIPCVVYADVTGPVEEGDDVLVNVQARELGLGSGGFDIVYANLTRGLELPAAEGAHVMALPYAPGQWAVAHAEEGGALAERLEGLPVVLCTVHSQVAPAWAALRELRVAYVQVAGGALALDLSDTVRTLGFGVRVSVAPCFGGDARCVSVASALLWAAARSDVVVCSVGPGIVGTGTRFGHGAVSLAEAANVASALGGLPVLAARVSDADTRGRHRGISHHTQAVLELCLGDVAVSSPDDGEGWREACAGLPLSHMGRGADEEPSHFAAAYAAGRFAAASVR